MAISTFFFRIRFDWLLWLGLGGLCLITLALPSHALEKDVVPPVYHQSGFWDGDWSQAVTGYKNGWPDAESTEMKSGIKEKDRCQQYWIPDKPKWDDIDLEQWGEYARHNETPYAVASIPFNLQGYGMVIPQGVYQLKLGQWNDGSSKTNRSTAAMPPPASEGKRFATGEPTLPAPPQAPPDAKTTDDLYRRNQQIETVVFIKMGKVVAVIPLLKVAESGRGKHYANHRQWGSLTPRENYLARKSENFARPTLSWEALPNGQVLFALHNPHGLYRFALNKQQQVESLRVK